MAAHIGLSGAIALFRQLAAVLSSGMSMMEAVEVMKRHEQSPSMKRFLRALDDSVASGRRISPVFRERLAGVPRAVYALIEAGEKRGRLDAAFRDAADLMERMLRTRRRIVSAFVYPGFVFVFAVLCAPVPRLVLEGPRAYIATVAPMVAVPAVLAAVMAALRWIYRSGTCLALTVARLYLLIPILGRIHRDLALVRFCRVFSASIRAGLEIFEAVRYGAAATGDPYLEKRIAGSAERVLNRGGTMAEACDAAQCFPPVLLRICAAGERSGKLDGLLDKGADMLEDTATTRVLRLLKIAGPLLLLCVALYIGYLVISFWSGYVHTLDRF